MGSAMSSTSSGGSDVRRRRRRRQAGGGLATTVASVGADDPGVGDLADHPPDRSQRVGPLPDRRARRRGHRSPPPAAPSRTCRRRSRRAGSSGTGDTPTSPRSARGSPPSAPGGRPGRRARASPTRGARGRHVRRGQAPASGPEAKASLDILLPVEVARVEPADGLERGPPHEQARCGQRRDLAHRGGLRPVGIAAAGPDWGLACGAPSTGANQTPPCWSVRSADRFPARGPASPSGYTKQRAHGRHIGRLERLDEVAEPVRPDGLHVVVEEEGPGSRDTPGRRRCWRPRMTRSARCGARSPGSRGRTRPSTAAKSSDDALSTTSSSTFG